MFSALEGATFVHSHNSAAHLFEPFSTGRDAVPGQSFGLGLAIVQSLVERSGGEIWYEPAAPHGARFVFRLPAA